jgi:hypothetical protein
MRGFEIILPILLSGVPLIGHAEPALFVEEQGLARVTAKFETPERLQLDCTNRKPTSFGTNWMYNCENAARKLLDGLRESGQVSFEVPRFPFLRVSASTVDSLGAFLVRNEVWAIGAVLDARTGERIALLAVPR